MKSPKGILAAPHDSQFALKRFENACEAELTEFLRKLLARDEAALVEYVGRDSAIFVRGRMNPKISEFLYLAKPGW